MTAPAVVVRDVEVEERPVDVALHRGRVSAIGPRLGLPIGRRAEVVEGQGGALLPGLHDHHLHLLSLAATRSSVDLTGLRGPESVRQALCAAAVATENREGWIRATGYHESIAGPLDRGVLDRFLPGRPLRVQHRSGALWVLNTPGLRRLSTGLDDSLDVERDSHGEPTGRLWRYDDRLRRLLSSSFPDMRWVGDRLRELGITGVTDATPDLDRGTVGFLGEQIAAGHLPPLTVLGAPWDPVLPAGIAAGPQKVMLRDHDLSIEEISRHITLARESGRAVALHCVTREAFVLVYATLRKLGSVPGDRIEHGALIPPELLASARRLGVRVVTQPDFVRTRGDEYRSGIDPRDLGSVYPYRSLIANGVPVAPSSDAPFGDLDPWQVMRSAAGRRTARGEVLGPGERVDPRVVLAGYLSPADEPGGPPRRLAVGAPADLVLLRGPLREVLAAPDASWVRRTFVASGPDRAGACPAGSPSRTGPAVRRPAG